MAVSMAPNAGKKGFHRRSAITAAARALGLAAGKGTRKALEIGAEEERVLMAR